LVSVLYVSWDRALDLCYKLAVEVAASGWRPDAIVAVLRGGVVPALVVSDVLGVDKFYAVRARHWGVLKEVYERPVIEQLPHGSLEGAKVLVVDEVADTGKTLKSVVEALSEARPKEVKTAVVHLKPTSEFLPDFYAEKLEEWKWIFYPWSLVETMYALVLRELGASASKELVEAKLEELGRALGIGKQQMYALKTGLRYYHRTGAP